MYCDDTKDDEMSEGPNNKPQFGAEQTKMANADGQSTNTSSPFGLHRINTFKEAPTRSAF